jgi:hypothetical protein
LAAAASTPCQHRAQKKKPRKNKKKKKKKLFFPPASPTLCTEQKVVLTRVWRQRDPDFVRLLNGVRFGHGEAAMEIARRCARPLPELDGIKPTQARAGPGLISQLPSPVGMPAGG